MFLTFNQHSTPPVIQGIVRHNLHKGGLLKMMPSGRLRQQTLNKN